MSSNFQDTFTKNDSSESLQYDEIAFYFYSSAILTITLIPLIINFLKQYKKLNKINKNKLSTCQCYYCTKKIQQLKTQKKKPFSFYVKAILILTLLILLGQSLKICMKKSDLKTFDPYEILGVEMGSDDVTIKKAFKKMAREYHPDKNPGDPTAHQKFILVNKAYQCLENEESRQNCQTSGNPEGQSGAFEVGIAMPTFLLKKENKLVILSLFFIFLLFILPALALYFYSSSDQVDGYGTEKSIIYRVLGFYKNENIQFKNFLMLISTSKDMSPLLRVQPEQYKGLKSLMKPDLIQGLSQNFQPFLKPYVLLSTYMMGKPITDPALQNDFQEILKRTVNILNSLIDLTVEFHQNSNFVKQIIGKEVKFEFVQRVIKFCQHFYQGIILHDSDFLQLAGVTEHNIDLINKKFKKKTVKQLLNSEEQQQRLFKILKIEKLIKETENSMKNFPQWEIKCENFVKVSEDQKDQVIRIGDIFTVEIQLKRLNKIGYIHSKNFPFLKQQILHIFAFYSETKKLIFYKKIVSNEDIIKESFSGLAQTQNNQKFDIYIMTDSYIGFDEKITHEVEILPQLQQEEYKIHPDDIEALQKGSLYQNMMKELQMEADSDNEEEEEEEEVEEDKEEQDIKEQKETNDDKQNDEMTEEEIIKDIKENN